MLSEKTPKNIERERRRGFRATFLLTFSGTTHAKHLLSKRFLGGHGPKLVSKVSDSYEAVQQRSKKHHARALSRAKGDDPLIKNCRFGIIPRIKRIQRIPQKRRQQLRRRPSLTHAPGVRMTVVTQTPSNEFHRFSLRK